MAHNRGGDERTSLVCGFAFPAFSRRSMGMKGLLAMLACGVLGGIGVAAADDAPKASGTEEAPLVVTSGYGVSGLVLWLAADNGVTLIKVSSVISLADKTGNFILTPNNEECADLLSRSGLNGRPVLRFNGNQSLYSPDNFGTALNRDMTIIFVAMTTCSPVVNNFTSCVPGTECVNAVCQSSFMP